MKLKLPLITVLALFGALVVNAAPGDLDPTFGGGGIVVSPMVGTPYYEAPSSMLIQPDGKIVVSGDIWTEDPSNGEYRVSFFIARYEPNGTLDSSFGVGGKVVAPINSIGDFVGEGIVLQPDGKILAVGYNGGTPVIAIHRYTPNGWLDNSFGSGGRVLTSVEGRFSIGSYATVQPDGKIVVGGFSYLPDVDLFAFAIVRYQSNGELDQSFGTAGKVVMPIGNNFVFVGAVLVQPDGKLVLVGGAGIENLFTLVRYNANGSLDPTFGTNGVVQHSIFGPACFRDGVLQPDGKIVAVGISNGKDVIIRYNSDGSMDDSFGLNGVFLADIHGTYSNSLYLQSDGKILVFSGVNDGTGPTPISVLRLNNNGLADQNFGVNGRVNTHVTITSFNSGVDGALQSDGKLVALAKTYEPGTGASDTVLLRYVNDSPAISGTVTYGNAIGAPASRNVSNVSVSAVGSLSVSALTGFPDGNYMLSGFGSGAYTVTPSKTGGVNGAITSFDAATVAKYAAGTVKLSQNQLIVADVSGNGTISSFDAGQIARYASGVPGAGSSGIWIFTPANRSYASVTSNVTGEDFIALLMGEVSGNWINTGARPR